MTENARKCFPAALESPDDVLPMLPGQHFIAGLASFLVAHLFYIAQILLARNMLAKS